MLTIADSKLWSRLTNRIYVRFHEGTTSTATLNNGSIARGSRAGACAQASFTTMSTTECACAISMLSGLILILYGRLLLSMAEQWWNDPDYSHGFLVPVFAAYILWRERGRRREVPVRESNWGLPVTLSAIGLLILGILGSEHFTARFSLLILISGIVVFLAGWQMLRSLAFPIGYLAFMIPLPAVIYYQLTFPLQILASRLGASGLVALGVPAVRQGNLLILPNCTLEVVEACSGVRSLLALVPAVIAYVYFAEPSIWKRFILIAAIVPTVVMTNGLRLVALGQLSYFLGPEVDTGLTHIGLGLAFFALSFLSILLTHILLRRFKNKQILDPIHQCRF